MTQRTPTPWQCVASTEHHGPYITSEYGSTIADLYVMSKPGSLSTLNGGSSKPVPFLHEMADPNADFIVRACNAHDALVAALEKVRSYNVEIAAERINYRPHDHIQIIDEALAIAKGEA